MSGFSFKYRVKFRIENGSICRVVVVKTSLSISRRSCSRYRQIAACCRSEITSASGSRNWVAHHSKVDWCRLVKTLEDQQTNLVLQALLNGQPVQSISDVAGDVVVVVAFLL